MKIIHALGWYFPESLGGTEVYVRALADRQKRRHSIAVAAPKPGLALAEIEERDSVTVFRYPIPVQPTRDEAQTRTATRGTEAFRDYLERSRPDVLHVHTFTTGLGLFELRFAKALGIKLVVTHHLGSLGYLCQRGSLMRWGDYPCDGIVRETKCAACELQHRGLPKTAAWSTAVLGGITGSRIAGRLGTALGMRELIRHRQKLHAELTDIVDRFVLLNEAARRIVVQNGGDPEKIALNYLGLSHHAYSRKPSPGEQPTTPPITVGYLGRFVAIKGILDLARAVASLPPELALRVELRGGGDDPDSRELEQRVRQITRGDRRVSIEPAVSPDDVPAVLRDFDVLCVPSVCFEGGPTVISEANAVGTPVIGTRIGAMPEIIRDGISGALVAPGDWRMLADVLTRIVHEPETVDRWRQALPHPRTMDEVADDYEALYQSLFR